MPPNSHSNRPLRYTGTFQGSASDASGSPILSANDRASVEDFSLNSFVALSKNSALRTSQTFSPCEKQHVTSQTKLLGKQQNNKGGIDFLWVGLVSITCAGI
jgi:hypothetical protein